MLSAVALAPAQSPELGIGDPNAAFRSVQQFPKSKSRASY